MDNLQEKLEPVLTLDQFAPAAPGAPIQPIAAEPEEKPTLDESQMTEAERQQICDFAKQIDLTNSNQVLMYGSGAQKKIADFSETALTSVRTKDLGEVGEMLTGVVNELRGMDQPDDKGLFGIFKKGKIRSMLTKYDDIDKNVAKIVGELEKHQMLLLKDAAMLDKMYELNKVYFKELSMYVLAGKRKLAETRAADLVALTDRARQSGLAEDAQSANDLQNLCDRFEKKLHDLELTRMISIQMAPQIRLVQNNDAMMSEKIQSTLVNTIPLWKSQMVLALGVSHSQQAAVAQREVSEITNEMLRKNAQTLKMATVETAKESERGVVDIETLKVANESLISTLDEVMKIQDDGRQRRRDAEVELSRIETELKQKLLEIRR
ncbi:MAG: toxic anion resistance protein [Angelakisella sp.]